MDLRSHYPRSVREKLGGYVHLARMIDKCRAVLTGTPGEYIYPCPMDMRLLEFAGISSEQFQAIVNGQPDGAIISAFLAKSVGHSVAEIEAWNEMLLSLGPNTEEKSAYFKNQRDAIDPRRTDITHWADLLDLEEGRPVPIRESTPTGG